MAGEITAEFPLNVIVERTRENWNKLKSTLKEQRCTIDSGFF